MKFQQTPFKHDPRSSNYSHERFFGSVTSFPNTLGKKRIVPHDQMNTLRCTGYGAAHNGEYIEGRRMSPDWSAAKIGEVQGRSVDINGADPNACMKAMRDYGFLPIEFAPYSLLKDGLEGSGIGVWPKQLEEATIDSNAAFVRVDGPHDIFDNIRNALLKETKEGKGACVDAFGTWYHEWSSAITIPSSYGLFAGYHRYLFVDWVTVDGTPFLVALNSYGTSAGENGYHYFPREVVNREFAKRGTSLKILKTLTDAQIALAKQETPYGRIQRAIIDIWYIISEKFGVYA